MPLSVLIIDIIMKCILETVDGERNWLCTFKLSPKYAVDKYEFDEYQGMS
jgi:hypothetical protein